MVLSCQLSALAAVNEVLALEKYATVLSRAEKGGTPPSANNILLPTGLLDTRDVSCESMQSEHELGRQLLAKSEWWDVEL